jgi:hypothetical protein
MKKVILTGADGFTGHSIETRTNPEFLRVNELHRLCGDPAKLELCLGPLQHFLLDETLDWMLHARC